MSAQAGQIDLEEARRHPLYGAVKKARAASLCLSETGDYELSTAERALLAAAKLQADALSAALTKRWRELSGLEPAPAAEPPQPKASIETLTEAPTETLTEAPTEALTEAPTEALTEVEGEEQDLRESRDIRRRT